MQQQLLQQPQVPWQHPTSTQMVVLLLLVLYMVRVLLLVVESCRTLRHLLLLEGSRAAARGY